MLASEIRKRGEEIIQRAREEGVREGERKAAREGERSILLRQLRRRFGKLPKAAILRLDSAERDQLEQWADRVLTARSLGEVLDGA